MKKTLLIALIALGLMAQASFAQAQQGTLKRVFGTILDEDDVSPLVGATVLMKTLGDSTLKGTSTDRNGKFEFKAPIPGSFVIEVSYVGYETFSQRFILVKNEDLGAIRILAGKLLEEIVIQGPPITGEMRGDTTVFNADAFKTRPDASAEELIRKLPGIQIEGNTIRAQGEEVQRVLVDGQRFFGNDPMTALRNLPAEIVRNVEIFDEQSDQSRLTGFDDGTRNRTINIVTKEEARLGAFGQVYAGYGTDDRYLSGVTANLFKGNTRFSIIGGANNVNQQNFTGADVIGGGGGGGGRGGRPGGAGAAGGGGGNGITETQSIGLNYSDVYGKNFEINASYFYTNRNTTVENLLARELILGSDQRQFYDEYSENFTDVNNNRFNSNITWFASKKFSLINRTNGSFQTNNVLNSTVGANSLPGDILLSATENLTTRTNENLNFSNNFTLAYRFDKPGRSLSANISNGINNTFGDILLNSLNFNPRINRADSLNQITDTESTGWNYNANLVYTEPITQKSNLQFTVAQGTNFTDSDQRVARIIAETGLTQLDTALSNVFDNEYLTRRAGVGYRFNDNRLSFNVNVNYQFAQLDNTRIFPTEGETLLTFKNILPTATGNYRIGPATNVRFNYRTTTQNPSVNQLQDVVNNNNPLLLSAGNPNLKQNFGHFGNLNFTKFDLETSRTYVANVTTNVTSNFIGNATYIARQDTLINGEIFLPAGGQFTRPENLGGSVIGSLFLTYASYFQPLKSNVSINTRVTYSQIPGLINGVQNFNRNTTIGPGITVASNVSPELDFTLSTSSSYNIVNSSIQQTQDNNFFNQTSFFRFFWRFSDRWFLTNTTTHVLFTGLGEEFNQSFWLVNAEIGRNIFAKNQGEIKLTVFDLLKQNQAISRTVSDISVQDTRTNVLTQYVMLNFTYNLRQFGANNNQRGGGGRPTTGGGMMGRGI